MKTPEQLAKCLAAAKSWRLNDTDAELLIDALMPDAEPAAKEQRAAVRAGRNERLAEAVCRVRAGERKRDVCAELDVHPDTVRDWLKRGAGL
jgi:hypothetical protein